MLQCLYTIMNIFKSTTFTWWQVGLFKGAMLCIGISIGVAWSDVFRPYVSALLVAGLLLSVYLTYIWLKNK